MSGCSSASCHTWQVLSEPCQQQLHSSAVRLQLCKAAGLYLLHTQRQEALLTTAACRHCTMLRASQSRFSSSLVPVALAVVFLAVSTTNASPTAPVAVPPVLAPGTETNVTIAPAQAPTAAAEAPAGTPTNPFGDTGFITVQGNKFVDANCKVC